MKNYFKITVFLAIAAFSFEKIQSAAAAQGIGLPTLWDYPEIQRLTLQLSARLDSNNLGQMELMEDMKLSLQRAFVSPGRVIHNQYNVLYAFYLVQRIIIDYPENSQLANALFEKCLNHGLAVTARFDYGGRQVPFFEKIIRGLIFTNDDYMRLILKHIPDLNSPLSNGKTIIQTLWDERISILSFKNYLKGLEEDEEEEIDLCIPEVLQNESRLKKCERLIELLLAEEAERLNQ